MKQKLLHIFFGIFILIMLIGMAKPACAEIPDISGKAYILVSADTGQVLCSENADEKWYPASTTKIMTLLLALEAIAEGSFSLDDKVTISDNAAAMGGSVVYLGAGETRSLEELLIGVAVGSGNDAAVAVAEYVGGSEEKFVNMMNERAKKLGMVGTHFANPHGLHNEEHYTTAADMAKLAIYAVQNTSILDYTSIYEYDFIPEPRLLKLWNTNRMLKWYDGTDGLKTGYTKEAKRNLVATVMRDNMRLISVVFGVEPANGHFSESMKLMNYGFDNYEYHHVYQQNEPVCSVVMHKGQQYKVEALAAQNLGFIAERGTAANNVHTSVQIETLPTAPIKSGQVLGEIKLLADSREVASCELIAACDVEKVRFFTLFKRIIAAVFSFGKINL